MLVGGSPPANVTGPAPGDRRGDAIAVAAVVSLIAGLCLAVAACHFAKWREVKKFAARNAPLRPLETATSAHAFSGWCLENNVRVSLTGVLYRWDPPEDGAATPVYLRGLQRGVYWCARGRIRGGEYVWHRYYPGTTYAVRFRGDAVGGRVAGSWTQRVIVVDVFSSRDLEYEGGFEIAFASAP